MTIRDSLAKRIQQKRQDVEALEAQLREAKAYLQALEDTFKLLPRDTAPGETAGVTGIRPQGSVAKAREALLRVGHDLHVADLVIAMGKAATRPNKQSIAGQLSAYAKRGEIFTKSGPNTFGLIEFGVDGAGTKGSQEGLGGKNEAVSHHAS